MKKLWKRVLTHVPMPILAGLIVLAVVGGGVFAYSAWQGQADITIDEAITVDVLETSDGSFSSGVWSVSVYPGEEKRLDLGIENASSMDLLVTFACGSIPVGITVSPEFQEFWVGGGHFVIKTVYAKASDSVAPGEYSFDFAISR